MRKLLIALLLLSSPAYAIDTSNWYSVEQIMNKQKAYKSTINSSTTVLSSGATYTGTWEQNESSDVMVSVQTDNTGTLYFDFSVDGVNSTTFPTNGFNVASGTHEFHTAVKGPRFFRVRFVNDSGTQTYFRLATYFGQFNKPSAPLNQVVGLDADAILVRTSDYPLQVQRGLYSDITFNNKFGRNTATATGDAIWAISTAYTEPASAAQCNVVSSSTNDDGSPVGTGARTISITGIDSNYDIVTETVTLDGITNVLTANSYWNIHRAYVVTAGSDSGAAGNISITSTASGTPVIGYLALGYNQTQSTVYMVPRNYTAYINLLNVSGQNTTANSLCDIGLFKKEFGGVFRVQADFNLTGSTTAYMPKVFGAPLKWEEKSTILFKCISATGGGTWDTAIDYDIWLVKNT